jgi:hypothetical protein
MKVPCMAPRWPDKPYLWSHVPSCSFRVAVLSKHVFHLNLFPTATPCSRPEASCIVATEGCVSRIECDAGKSCTEAVAHARGCGKECEKEEKRNKEQQAQED